MLALTVGSLALNIGARVATPRAPIVTMQAAAPAMVEVRRRAAPFFACRVRSRAVYVSCVPFAHVLQGALETVELKNGDSSATVYKFGACVTSYKKGDTDYLMVRPDAKMDGSKPISGGIPFCFPQFGPGAIQQHGFARNVDWAVSEKSADKVVFTLSEDEYTLGMWPYKFTATYSVTLKADKYVASQRARSQETNITLRRSSFEPSLYCVHTGSRPSLP